MPPTIRVAQETGVAGVVVAGALVAVVVCGAVDGGTVGTVVDVAADALELPGAEELVAPAPPGGDEQAAASTVSPATTAGPRRPGRRRNGRRWEAGIFRP
jgi:hypothetical protein